ncbi:HAMP domain-containing protein [Candidatus Ozemobacteraceae bacterium]|nr:HAMP domain-containing protein [Candidatus Ozemobacteraceae bacterium]
MIRPREISPEARLLFWFLVILLPFLFLRFAFHEVIRREERANLLLVKRELMNEVEETASRLRPERMISETLREIEVRAGFPPFDDAGRYRFSRDARLPFEAASLTETLWRDIERTFGTAPLFLFTLGPDGRECDSRMNPAYVTRLETLPRRHVQAWLHGLARTPGRALWDETRPLPSERARWEGREGIARLRKEINRFINYYFGMYAIPFGSDGQAWSFFTHRFGGGKLVLYQRFVTAHGKPDAPILGGYLAGFFEPGVPFDRLAGLVAERGNSGRFTYSFRRGRRLQGVLFTRNSRGIAVWNPLRRDLLLNVSRPSGRLDIPLIGVRVGWQEVRHPARNSFPLIDALLTLGGVLTLCLLLFGDRWELVRNLDIRGKFVLAMGLAMSFPLLTFWTVATAFFSFHQRLEIKRELITMAERLALFEHGLKSYSLSHRVRLLKWHPLLGSMENAPLPEVARLLDVILKKNSLDMIHLIRRDGRHVTRTHTRKDDPWRTSQIEQAVTGPFTSLGWAILKFVQSVTPEAEALLKKNSGMVSAIALLANINHREINGILLQEFKPLQIAFSGDRDAQYSIEIISGAGASAHVPVATLFSREVFVSLAERYMLGLKNPLGILSDERSAFQTRAGLFSLPFLQGEPTDTLGAWPVSARTDPLLRSVARQALDSGREGTWNIRENGVPMLFAVRKFHPLPFVAVAAGHWRSSLPWWQSETGWALLLAGYSFGILFLQGMFLAGVFARPLKRLTEAAARVGKGELDFSLDLDTGDEFAVLGREFSQMTRGLRERQRLTRFVSDEAVEAARDDRMLTGEAGGARVCRSVLFAHIRGFASLAERHPPEEIMALLNRYFAEMETAIVDNRGTIDKYIGDAIMAVFRPLEGEPHQAIRAARTAAAMKRTLDDLNRDRSREGAFTISIGIGIATGEMIAGWIGSEDGRQSLTVIGDTVNLAARIESRSELAEQSGIAVCRETADACRETLAVAPIGAIHVKGKELPVELFELMPGGGS